MTDLRRPVRLEPASRGVQWAHTGSPSAADLDEVDARRLSAAGAAHDVNNLLGVVALQVELIRRHHDFPAALLGDLQRIVEAVDRAGLLTRRVLEDARTAGSGDPGATEFDAADAVAELVELLRPTLAPAGLVVELLPATVAMDRAAFDQVAMNLLLNARHAAGAAGGHGARGAIHIGVHPAPATNPLGGPATVLSFGDDGPGMAPQVLDHVFEPYFTTGSRASSAGLGLTTVQRAVGQAGGRLDLVSTPAGGTTATVWLPRPPVPAVTAPSR